MLGSVLTPSAEFWVCLLLRILYSFGVSCHFHQPSAEQPLCVTMAMKDLFDNHIILRDDTEVADEEECSILKGVPKYCMHLVF